MCTTQADVLCTSPEGRAEAVRSCPHCGDPRLQRWGTSRSGMARLHCRSCRRTSCASTGTSAAGIRHRAAFQSALRDMCGPRPSSCRVLAARLGVHRMTIWRWRMRVFSPVRQGLPDLSRTKAAASCRESRKASREWVNHERWPEAFPRPPRSRWRDLHTGETPPGGWHAWHVPIVLMTSAPDTERTLLVAGRRGDFTQVPRRPQDASGLVGRLLEFLVPFRGPATRHLPSYLAWMETREMLVPRVAAG